MHAHSTPSKRSIRNCDSGFTIVELLVASVIGAIMTVMTVGAILAQRNVYEYDLVRQRLNQDMRSALDIIGMNVREAGENLPDTFPAVEVINGSSGGPDQLVLRRNLLDEILKLCDPIAGGSSTSDIYFATNDGTPGCTYSDQVNNYNTWSTYRSDNGGQVRAYIYDPTTQLGEFFDYNDETDTGFEMYVERTAGTWTNSYTVGSTAVYMLEEWHFQLDEHLPGEWVLQLIENDDDANPMNVVYNVEDLQIDVMLEDSSTQSSFDATDDWTELRHLDISINATETINDRTINATLTAEFFPRNILSH